MGHGVRKKLYPSDIVNRHFMNTVSHPLHPFGALLEAGEDRGDFERIASRSQKAGIRPQLDPAVTYRDGVKTPLKSLLISSECLFGPPRM